MVEILIAIAGPIARIVENATSDNYDKQKELDAMLDLEKAVYDARMRALLQKK